MGPELSPSAASALEFSASAKRENEAGNRANTSHFIFFFAFEIPRIWGKGVGGERAAAAKKKMASNFSFPPLAPEQIAEALHTYGLAPTANLRAEDIANPQPDLLPAVISNFLATVVDPTGCVRGASPPLPLAGAARSVFVIVGWRFCSADDLDGQLGFDALASLDNPEHYREGIRVLRLHKRANAFLESIQFPGFTLRDLLRPDPRRLVQVLSALINFLYYRDEKLALLQPIIHEFPNLDERCMELKAKLAEV